MNFTQTVKREILSSIPQKECCRRALFCALIDACGSADSEFVEFTSENERLGELFFALAESFGLQPELDGAVYDARSKRDRVSFCLRNERAKSAFSIYRSCNCEELDPCCAIAYVRGAFLGCGSCLLPHEGAKSGYHLEFAFSNEARAEKFCIVLESLLCYTKTIRRGDQCVVYFKSREAVSDFLSAIDAKNALKEFETVMIRREQNNFINRVENCVAGNADKSMTASAEQAHRIRKIEGSEIFSNLPKPLKELAEERLNNPTLSLSELAARAGVSKSCLNHRMRKLMDICRRAEEENL